MIISQFQSVTGISEKISWDLKERGDLLHISEGSSRHCRQHLKRTGDLWMVVNGGGGGLGVMGRTMMGNEGEARLQRALKVRTKSWCWTQVC